MNILVAIDGNQSTPDVIATAAQWAREGDEVHVLHIVSPREARATFSTSGLYEHRLRYPVPAPSEVRLPVETAPQAAERVHQEYEQLVRAILADYPGTEGWSVDVDVADDPVDSIVAAVERADADVVVIGKQNRGRIASAVLGSVASELVDRSPVPVLLAREGMTRGSNEA